MKHLQPITCGAKGDVVSLCWVESHAADVSLTVDGVYGLAPVVSDRPDFH